MRALNGDRPSIPRALSPSIMHGQGHRQYAAGLDTVRTGFSNLITLSLWNEATGENLTSDELYQALEQVIPPHEGSAAVKNQMAHLQQYVIMSKDPNKSRNLQKRMQECPQSERNMIFNALSPYLNELVYDQSANFVIQKLCEGATPEQQKIMLDFFLTDINNIVDHSIACRVLQRFIECSTEMKNVDTLFKALLPNLMSLCFSQNGNHIVQRFVVALPDRLNTIIESILPNVIPLAIDNCGCRIVQRLFEQYKINQLSLIVNEVMKHSVDLATNQYGNYVVQYILSSGQTEYVSALLKSFKGKFYSFSIHKFASNVIEKCIRGASDQEREDIFDEIIGTSGNFNHPRILSMVEDQFGNYVIQRIIEFGTPEQQTAVFEVVYDNYDRLYSLQYARHVLQRLQHLGFEF